MTLDTDVSSLVAFFVPGVLIPAVLLVRAMRGPTPHRLAEWARSNDLVLTDRSAAAVSHHLRRVRRIRSIAAFPFWWLATVPLVIGPVLPSWLTTFTVPVGVYLLASVVAELTAAPIDASRDDPDPGIRLTPLAARRIRDYLPDWVRLLPWMLIGLAAIAGAVLSTRSPDGKGTFLLGLGAAILVTGVASLAAPVIVRRPQRGDASDLLAADDALRATGLAAASSIGLIAGLAALTSAIAWVGTGQPAVAAVAIALSLLSLPLTVAAITVVVRQESWGHRVRFPTRAPNPAPAP